MTAVSRQSLALFNSFLIVLMIYDCCASIENIDLNYTQPGATFDELYSDATDLYSNDSWSAAIRSFNLALADYRHESQVKANCLIECRQKTDKSSVFRNEQYDAGSLILYYTIRVRRCCDLCQEKFMGRRTPVPRYVRDAFAKREPYNYLQFSYFKMQQYQNAANAAFTFLERNQGHKTMLSNLNFYTSKSFNATKQYLKSLETQPHIDLFFQGDEEYRADKFPDCVHTFEAALDEYYKEHGKCQALCEYQHERHQASFSVALFSHHTAILQCKMACSKELSFVKGKQRDKYLEDHYHYLQFCYFEVGRLKEAAICAKTYLLFNPDDPIMAENMKFYSNTVQLKATDIFPRKRAENYIRHQLMDKKLAQTAKYYVDPDVLFHDDVQQLDDLVDGSDDDSTKLAKGQSTKNSGSDEESVVPLRHTRWKKNPLFKGINLFQEGKDLNGTNRFTVDNMSTPDQCKILRELVDKLSKFGDGYNHNHADPKHPFTDKETFEGVSIGEAVVAAVNNKISLEEAELYADLSDKMKDFVAAYFDLQMPLHISYTHLVCRTASDDENAGTDSDHLSHPVHSDNCILGADGPGTCPKVHPAYTWRDFSSVLYLNDDFKGGEFIFADENQKLQAAVTPTCGRMVAFSGGIKNLHGVLGVKSGRRCALPLWFTYQEDKIEDKRGKYQEILNNLRRQKNEQIGLANKLTHVEDHIVGDIEKVDKLKEQPSLVDEGNAEIRGQVRSEL